MQYDGAASHTPLLQNFEQQSLFAPHVLPEVLQDGLSGMHVPELPQTPPQHWSFAVHAAPSDLHWLPEHWKLTHENEQQSGPTEQLAPEARHLPATCAHNPTRESQLPVQHSLSVVHAVPVSVHAAEVSFLLPPHATTSTTTIPTNAFFMTHRCRAPWIGYRKRQTTSAPMWQLHGSVHVYCQQLGGITSSWVQCRHRRAYSGRHHRAPPDGPL